MDRPFRRIINVVTGEETREYLTDEEIAQREIEAAQEAAAVPREVSPYQARKALKQYGMLRAVSDYMNSLPEDDDAHLAWTWASVVRRDSPFIVALGPQFGLTDAQIDDLFRLAATIP